MDNVSIELRKAFSEVNKILSLMEEKYVKKVPKKLIQFFIEEKSKDYEPIINVNEPLNEQKIQRKTLAILAMLNLNYWCETEEEKQELLKIYAENDKKKEKEIREKYKIENLFKNREKENEKVVEESTKLIEYKKENLFKIVLNKIKNFFKKKI